jgi:hypothetical protein
MEKNISIVVAITCVGRDIAVLAGMAWPGTANENA